MGAATLTKLETGLSRIEVAERAQAIMKEYRFMPPRKRGGQKARSRGGRPYAVDASTVIKLEEAFMLGCSVIESCFYAGISKETYYNWLELNPKFVGRIEALKANPTIIARNSVVSSLRHDGELALKYLERKLPEEFSLKGATVNIGMAFDGISLDKPKIVANVSHLESSERVDEVTKPQLPS